MNKFAWVLKTAEDNVMQANEYATGRIHKHENFRMCKSSVKMWASVADYFFNIVES